MVDYAVRPCQPGDEVELAAIYEMLFTALDGVADIEKTTRLFLERVYKRKVLVAENASILGFAGYDLVRDVPASLVDGAAMEVILNRELFYSRHPESRQKLQDYLQKRQQEIGKGEVIIESFENEFTKRNFPVSPDDVYCLGLGVIPRLQQNGVGKALIAAREQAARDLGASALYVHCWCGGKSPKAHYDLGYQPILKAGPEYEDGSASLLFGKKLK